MPETDDERRAPQAAIEQAERARLHGVEMPKRLDFTSKKLHHEYLCFQTLAKKVLECYDGLEDSVQVNEVLMWMHGARGMRQTRTTPIPTRRQGKTNPAVELL